VLLSSPWLRRLPMTSDAREYSGQDPSEQQPSPEGQDRFERLLDGLLRPQDSLRGQQQQLWACLQSMKSLTAAVVQQLASEPLSLAWQTIGHRQVLSDLRALQAWLLSLELLLQRTGEVGWPHAGQRLAQQLVGPLAPDPYGEQWMRLNQLLDCSTLDG